MTKVEELQEIVRLAHLNAPKWMGDFREVLRIFEGKAE